MSSEDGVPRFVKKRPLSFLSVVALIFFEVAGGPFGIEDTVRYGGPSLALLGLIVLPILWSVPEALVTAELATMFPENSGPVAWVTAAFGPFWGFLEGAFTWISGVIDNSIYPLFLARYLKWFIPALQQTLPLKAFLVVSSIGLSYLNYRGLGVVGKTAIGLTIFILLPFVALTVMGIQRIDPSRWFEFPDSERLDLVAFINVMFWNINYWDSVASLCGEISNVATVLPKALFTAVLLVCSAYFVPVLVGVGILGSDDWPEGFFGFLGREVGGVWLEGWIVLAAVASQMGLFIAELSSDAYLILGLAEKGVLPKKLAHLSPHGTPTYALLLSCSGVIVMLISFSFVSTVQMLNILYCLAELLEFFALIKLRTSLPNVQRPFKIPLEASGLCAMLFPCSLFLVAIVAVPFVTLDVEIVLFIIISCSISVGLYYFFEHARKHQYIAFNRAGLLLLSDYQALSHGEDNHVHGHGQLEESVASDCAL